MTGGSEDKKRKQRKSNNSIPGNPFKIVNVPPSSPVNTDSTELRISDDPKKLLALLAAFVGLFTNHSKDDSSSGWAGQDQDPPNKILANVALLLGLSAAVAANGDATPPVNGSIEHLRAPRKEEDGYREMSKKQRTIRDSDAESIPDSSQCTPPPTKSEGSPGYSPDSAASVATRSMTARSSAASIDLLNLVNASIHNLEEISRMPRLGVTLSEEGQKKVNEAKHILFSAVSEIPSDLPKKIFKLTQKKEIPKRIK